MWHVRAVRYLGLVLGATLICGCGPFSGGSTATAPGSRFPPSGAVIVLDDPLRDNSKGYQWAEGLNSPSGDCRFDKQAYQLVASSSVGDTVELVADVTDRTYAVVAATNARAWWLGG